MIIGLISDTHGYVSDAALDALSRCDTIIHAGDIGSVGVLIALQNIAPVVAVRGNCDWQDLGPGVERFAEPVFDGVRFHVVHRPNDVRDLSDDVRVVVHGHTHRKRREMIGDVLWLNPGSATEPRDGGPASVACLSVEDGTIIDTEFIDLEDTV